MGEVDTVQMLDKEIKVTFSLRKWKLANNFLVGEVNTLQMLDKETKIRFSWRKWKLYKRNKQLSRGRGGHRTDQRC